MGGSEMHNKPSGSALQELLHCIGIMGRGVIDDQMEHFLLRSLAINQIEKLVILLIWRWRSAKAPITLPEATALSQRLRHPELRGCKSRIGCFERLEIGVETALVAKSFGNFALLTPSLRSLLDTRECLPSPDSPGRTIPL